MEVKEKRLGEILLEDGAIKEDQLEHCLFLQKNNTKFRKYRIGEIMLSLGYIEKYKLIKYLVIQGSYDEDNHS